jgi:uncharacterized membrane protein
MVNISATAVLNDAWQLFQKQGASLVLIMLVYGLTAGAFGLLIEYACSDATLGLMLGGVLQFLVDTVLALGFYAVALDVIAGRQAEMSRLFSKRSPVLLFHSFIGSLIVGLAIALGFIFLVIPGIYFALRLQYFNVVLIEQESPDFWAAIETSWKMTEGHVFGLLGVSLLSILVVIAGLLALFVGLFVAIPVVFLMNVLVYRQLQTRAGLSGV